MSGDRLARWTLTGGGALAGVHLGHRETRDLDLFWRDRAELGTLLAETLSVLRTAGLDAQVLRTSPAFSEVRVSDGASTCIVDLVAEPFSAVAPPEQALIDGTAIAVDGKHELLASKLATLLERSEIRDLVDVKALLEAGGDLDEALRDAPRKDAGFSPLTLAWALKDYDPRPAAKALGWSAAQSDELLSFTQELVARLTGGAAPE